MRRDKREIDYENAWGLLNQMVDYYTAEKKYLTKKEIKYIISACEKAGSGTPVKLRCPKGSRPIILYFVGQQGGDTFKYSSGKRLRAVILYFV